MRICLPRMKACRWFAGLAAAVSAVVIMGLVPAASASTVTRTGLTTSSGSASLATLSIAGSAPSPVADAALTTIVDTYSEMLGYPRDVSVAVTEARLPGQLASALAAELSQLYACDLFTQSGVNRLLKTISPGLPLGFPPVSPVPIQTAGQTILGLPLLPLLRPPSVTPSSIRPGGPIDRAIATCGHSVVNELQAVRDTLAGLGPCSGAARWTSGRC